MKKIIATIALVAVASSASAFFGGSRGGEGLKLKSSMGLPEPVEDFS